MLLFFYGEDVWRKQQKLDQLAERFVKEVDPSKLNLLILAQEDAQEQTLRSHITAAPFLARKRLIILKNFLTAGKSKWPLEILQNALEHQVEQTMYVVSEDASKPKTWKYSEAKALWEYLEKNAPTEEFKPLWGSRFEAALAQAAKKRNLSFAPEALALLADYCGSDLGQAEQELEKLTAYKSKEAEPLVAPAAEALSRYMPTTAVTHDDVRTVCISSAESSIFDFLDALGNKDQITLLRTAEEQFYETDAFHVLNRATNHLRALLIITLAGAAGTQALKLHPFVEKKAVAQARKWNAEELRKMLFALMALEHQAKAGLAPDLNTQLTALLTRV